MLRKIFKTTLITSILFNPFFAYAEEGTKETAAQDGAFSPEDLFSLDMEVFSPAKKVQKLKNVPSAVYVLTEEDIQRSAVTTFPDLLRLVPGLNVAKVSSHEYAISSRGFNEQFANKLLLLIDGFPVETLTFNGVFWENFNLPLDLIERIEVVRGPGAAVWGTRAVNGVINVITKDANTFPYHKVEVGGGNEHLFSSYARTGVKLSPDSAIQAHVKYDRFDASQGSDGRNLNDEWSILSAGVRGDFQLNERDSMKVVTSFSSKQNDFQVAVPTIAAPYSNTVNDVREHYRGSLSMNWDRVLSEDSQVSFEMTNYFEKRKDFLIDFETYTSDFEFRHRFKPSESHDFTYGLNSRFYNDQTEGSETLSFDPENRSLQYYRGFIHDEINLIDDKLILTLGSRFEQNAQVGFNALPTGRLLWNVSDSVSVWGAVSYTVGTASRVNDDLRLNFASFPDQQSGLPVLVRLLGDRGVKSEKLVAYEIGAWVEPVEKVYFSVTGFVFKYNDIISRETGSPTPDFSNPNEPFILLPVTYQNSLSANSGGVEFALDWSYSESINMALTYAYLNLYAKQGDSMDLTNIGFINNSPRHSANLRTSVDLSDSLVSDFVLRFVDKLNTSQIDSYFQADVQFKWFVTPKFDLTLVGRNLLEDSHPEFKEITFSSPQSEVERSVFVRGSYSF